MLLKWHYYRCLETYGRNKVEFWVRILSEDDSVLLDYHGIRPHRRLHHLLLSFGKAKGTESSFQLTCGEDYYLALEIPELIQEVEPLEYWGLE